MTKPTQQNTPTTIQDTASPDNPPINGLHYGIAQTLQQVIDSWSLVYKSYLRLGLINTNPCKIHTVPHILTNDSLVALGKIDIITVSTLTVYEDGPNGLPLDTIYPDELRNLREQNRHLFEFGLFADRREQLFRSVESFLQLMRFTFAFCNNKVDNGDGIGLIGVHPHHVDFYTRLFGFDVIGDVKSYPMVKNNLVVLLQLDGNSRLSQKKLPRGLASFIKNPISANIIDSRFRITPDSITNSPIDKYFKHETTSTHTN